MYLSYASRECISTDLCPDARRSFTALSVLPYAVAPEYRASTMQSARVVSGSMNCGLATCEYLKISEYGTGSNQLTIRWTCVDGSTLANLCTNLSSPTGGAPKVINWTFL
jgi:hypothetical protein